MAKLPDEILNGRLERDGSSGDGKRCFLAASSNDGWRDLRIEVDTDDVDQTFANKWIKRLIECVNACAGIENPKQFIQSAKNAVGKSK